MFNENIKFKYTWRQYQDRVLKDANKHLSDGKVNIVAAPGSGKTILGLELARRLGKPVIIFAPTVTIKKQWISKFISSFTDFKEVPDWISTDIYNLKYFNVVTYQALHYAYKKKKINNEEVEDTDDIIEDDKETVTTDEIKNYDIVQEIKNKGITTLVLDEAHHLQSEWWKSLKEVTEKLGDIKIIALTATPPYDVEKSIWENYVSLCGEIDEEISVPELVKAKNLCPHQDYIYFNYPTKSELENIKNYDIELKKIINEIKQDKQFVEAVNSHQFIQNPNENIEKILDNPEYYSSQLIFLKNAGKPLGTYHTQILGHNKAIPSLSLEWLEILLKNVFITDRASYENFEELISNYEKKLNKIGAIEKKNLSLADNKTIQRYFVNSLGKLNSISEIVNIEHSNMKDEMRMVILTDYIRKEYATTEEITIDKIGVLPIFKTLVAKYDKLKFAILTGGLFVIPKELSENVYGLCTTRNINADKLKFKPFVLNENYVEVDMPETIRNDVMNCISKLFEIGKIQVIIGTKSLLGEGWDEPSINSLILATFVGSFMLSNQMRGRAIRTNSNPNKTANIWHLVCVCDNLDDDKSIENADFNLLKRRFQSFSGIGYTSTQVTNGIERLGIFEGDFSENSVSKINNEMIEYSNNREKMYKDWENAVESKSNNMQMVEEAEVQNIQGFTSEWLISKTLVKVIIAAIIVGLILIIGIIPRWITFFVELGLIIYIVRKVNEIKKISTSEGTVKAISEVLLQAMQKAKIIGEPNVKVKITNDNGKISSHIEGASIQESGLFVTSLTEMFSKFENQRYILVAKTSNISKYYNVPKIFATNKETAEGFVNIWKSKIGNVELIYTRNPQGRKELLKARMQNLNNKNNVERKQKLYFG
ncbi:MAG: DEAD/DEAH box helicase family protein [Clostridia bacterium]|nr:DEAD/DEAH box helicase family protein [Clostridia bacterium]